jgi:hypothetical protein
MPTPDRARGTCVAARAPVQFRFLALGTLALAACNAGHLDDGSPTDQGVSPGTVTLRLELSNTPSFCDVVSQCGVGTSHFSFRTVSGEALEIGTRYCATDCSTCARLPCPAIPACATPTVGQLVTEVETSWDGSYVASGTCGNGVACVSQRFVRPGRYDAHLCATPGMVTTSETTGSPCTPTGDSLCVDVPFDLPGPSPVAATLGSIQPPPPPI